jgi:hypothetical protein
MPEQPVKFKLWFYGVICIEEIIGWKCIKIISNVWK